MESIQSTSVFKHRDDVRYRVVDGEAVVIKQVAGEVLGVNAVGARLLDLIDAKTPVRRLVNSLASEFDVEREELERDVIEFLRELLEADVIERVG